VGETGGVVHHGTYEEDSPVTGEAPRSRCTGGGFKPPMAAVFKRDGGERNGKRQGETLSGVDRRVERE